MSEQYFACDIERLMILRRDGALPTNGERVGKPIEYPSQLILKTLENAWAFKLTAFANEALMAGGASTRDIEKELKAMRDGLPASQAINRALEKTWQMFLLRQIRTAADMARFSEMITRWIVDGDGTFVQRLARVLRRGTNPWMDKVDIVILFNWESNSNWHLVRHEEGELTLPDDLRHPLKEWSDNAALEYVRYFSGLKHNLSAAAYVQRRKRWGLHPSRPSKVKSAKITLCANLRTWADFAPQSRTKKTANLS